MTLIKHNAPSKGLASNKPPEPPNPPDPNLFVQSIALPDGRTIWVSVPQPDKLSFTSYILKGHFGSGAFVDNVQALAEGLSGAQVVKKGGSEPNVFQTGSLVVQARVPLGPRGSEVHLTLTRKFIPDELDPAFQLRLECNPRKLGQHGFQELIDLFHQAAPKLNLSLLLANAVLTRLDIAIDLAGVTPGELVIRCIGEGKTVAYRGANRELETLQIHQAKKVPVLPKKATKALGKLLLKAYDRNRQRQALGKPVPYPGFQTTRLEVVQKRFAPGVGLTEIPTFNDRFAHVTALDRDTLAPKGELEVWRAYTTCRLAMTPDEVASMLALDPWYAKLAEATYATYGHNILYDGHWSGWQHGLDRCGLGAFIKLTAGGTGDKL